MRNQGDNRYGFFGINTKLRERLLLTQTEFAEIVGIVVSAVNRWEVGKARPNIKVMKNIKSYCEKNRLLYEDIEEAWLNYKIEKSEVK